MFGNFMFPDFTKVDYDEFNELQKFFLEWLLDERTKSLLTFPVLTEASLNAEDDAKDLEWADFIAEIRAKGLSMFSFNDKTASSLSSCCFRGNETIKVIEKDTGNEIGVRISDFVELINMSDSYVDQELSTGYSIKSLNPKTLETEIVDITGILKKNASSKMLTIEVIIGNKLRKISVTPDHIFIVKDKESGEILELRAEELVKSFTRYQIPTMK
jgi:hypothetical protein